MLVCSRLLALALQSAVAASVLNAMQCVRMMQQGQAQFDYRQVQDRLMQQEIEEEDAFFDSGPEPNVVQRQQRNTRRQRSGTMGNTQGFDSTIQADPTLSVRLLQVE